MKLFYLERLIDDSGVSGTGKVAEGVVFKNGEAALHWLGKRSSITIYHSIDELVEIHGHGGHTQLRWSNDESN
jgi:hypothetical protein